METKNKAYGVFWGSLEPPKEENIVEFYPTEHSKLEEPLYGSGGCSYSSRDLQKIKDFIKESEKWKPLVDFVEFDFISYKKENH